MNKTVILPLTWLSSLAVVFFIGSRLGSAGYGDSQDADSKKNAVSGESSSGDGRAINRKLSSNRGINERLSDRDPASSVDSAGWESLAEQMVKSANPIARRLAFNQLLRQLTPENAAEMHKRLVELGFNRNERDVFNHTWGAIAGQEALDIAAQSSRDDLGAFIGGWASTDPAGALAMLDDLPENLALQIWDLEMSIVMGVSANDLPLATDLAERFVVRFSEHNIMGTLASQVIRSQGREAAMVWAESLSDGTKKGQALNRMVQSLNEKSPQAAAEWVGKFADQGYAAGAITTATQAFAKADPASTASWLESLPEGKTRTEAFKPMMSQWKYNDPQAAADYLSEMPDSRERDSAISGFVQMSPYREDPRTAIPWAKDISDPALRQETLILAATRYLQKYPAEALDWLPTSGLSEEAQQKILSPR